MNIKFDISIYLTFSKFIAFIILIFAFILELKNEGRGIIFEIALPVIVLLITGKQYFDRGIEKKKQG